MQVVSSWGRWDLVGERSEIHNGKTSDMSTEIRTLIRLCELAKISWRYLFALETEGMKKFTG